jgi:DNA-binding winged helix-turn-helix (wHTH) protein
MMAAIWPKLVVEENNLNKTISVLRRALGETPDDHRFIVTVPSRGYRFVARVTVVHAPEPAAPEAAQRTPESRLPPRAWRKLGYAAALAAAAASVVTLVAANHVARGKPERPGDPLRRSTPRER